MDMGLRRRHVLLAAGVVILDVVKRHRRKQKALRGQMSSNSSMASVAEELPPKPEPTVAKDGSRLNIMADALVRGSLGSGRGRAVCYFGS